MMNALLQHELAAVRRGYFEHRISRPRVFESLLALIGNQGAVVIDALPPPWKQTFVQWARERYDAVAEHVKTWLDEHAGIPALPEPSEDVRGLLLLTADMVDYPALTNEQLFGLAISHEEPYIATSALGELAQRRGYEARDAAETILLDPFWDRYLTSSALDILFDTDLDYAVDVLKDLLERTDDPVILTALANNVLYNEEQFATGALHALARQLTRRVAAIRPDGLYPESLALLLERYGDRDT